MSYQIIKQPDGQLAVFSTVTDTIVVYDADDEEIEAYFITRAVQDTLREVRKHIDNVRSGQADRSYFQFTMTWNEALTEDRAHGGDAWKEFR